MSAYPVLDGIRSPRDLDAMEPEELSALAAEIRSFLIEKVTKNGGHLSSNLGDVELTLALHRVFECPFDKFVFDVGHQSYTHKILTGRRDAFDSLRKDGGLSGFPKRRESEYDCFGTGHSSTSVSAALGIAEAERKKETGAWTVALLGDGSFTGGMVHEALNNCENRDGLRLILVLNDNGMSITENTGRFAKELAGLKPTPKWYRCSDKAEKFFAKVPWVGNALFRWTVAGKKKLRKAFYGANLFEELGLYYVGPVDGHDIEKTEAALKEAKDCGKIAVVHVRTVKGKGFDPAEKMPDFYHAVAPQGAPSGMNFAKKAGEILCDLAAGDSRICAVTPATRLDCGLTPFMEQYPDCFYDVGIAEGHALTFAAGLAADGMYPVVSANSSFLQRAYDSILHDISIQKLHVVLCVGQTGLNSAGGPTHHGLFDVAYLCQNPGMTVFTPASYAALETALKIAVTRDGACAVRYPACGEDPRVVAEFYAEKPSEFAGVRFSRVTEDTQIVLVAHGRMVSAALKAADLLASRGISCGVALCEMIKPYAVPATLLATSLPATVQKMVFVEEEIRAGGFGMLLKDELDRSFPGRFGARIVATDDNFAVPKPGQTVYEAAGVDEQSIAATAERFVNS